MHSPFFKENFKCLPFCKDFLYFLNNVNNKAEIKEWKIICIKEIPVCQLSGEITIQSLINNGNSHGLIDESSFCIVKFSAIDQYP